MATAQSRSSPRPRSIFNDAQICLVLASFDAAVTVASERGDSLPEALVTRLSEQYQSLVARIKEP